MPHLVIQFSCNDEALRSAIQAQFGDDAEIAEVRSFDGFAALQAIIPIVLPLSPSIVDFFVRHQSASERRDIASERIAIITPKKKIILFGYSAEELTTLLPELATESPPKD